MTSYQVKPVGSLRGAALRSMPVPPLVHHLKLQAVNNISVPTLEMVYRADPHLSKRVLVPDSNKAYRILLHHYTTCPPDHPAQISILLLNKFNRALGLCFIDRRRQRKVLADPLFVFAPALRTGAARIVLGNFSTRFDLAPYPIERLETKDLVTLGIKMQIDVIDHIIYNEHRYYSFTGHGLIKLDHLQ